MTYVCAMTQDLTVIYNDSCPICAREVSAYRRYTEARGVPVTYLGLSSDRLATHGLTKRDAARRLHVVQDGQVISGVPAFALLWDRIPRLRWLAWLVRRPVIASLAALIYDHILAPALFAMHRRRERLGRSRPLA